MLGKRPAVEDPRTLKLNEILRLEKLPEIPAEFSCTEEATGFPLRMYRNDRWGDCVIAARANHTVLFEFREEACILDIADTDVLNEYWKEQGGGTCWNKRPDNGLVMLYSMRDWRTGWKACGKKYSSYAFGQISSGDEDSIKAAVYLLGGVQVGLNLPITASGQFEAGEPWEVVSTSGDGRPGSWGGHAVWLSSYHLKDGKIRYEVVTWGKKQEVSPEFLQTYGDEAYGVVDNRNTWLGDNSPVDVEKLDSYLKQLEL
jgi:hypothetical protein